MPAVGARAAAFIDRDRCAIGCRPGEGSERLVDLADGLVVKGLADQGRGAQRDGERRTRISFFATPS
jgi:hypothetical protein